MLSSSLHMGLKVLVTEGVAVLDVVVALAEFDGKELVTVSFTIRPSAIIAKKK